MQWDGYGIANGSLRGRIVSAGAAALRRGARA